MAVEEKYSDASDAWVARNLRSKWKRNKKRSPTYNWMRKVVHIRGSKSSPEKELNKLMKGVH